jgi:MoaA/NifB/PqqE/SkfB family radical SAM enzyme
MKTLSIKDNKISVIANYNKYTQTDTYEIYFNTKTGFELIRGINGHKDPFHLEFPALLDIGIMGHCKNKCEFCYQGRENEPHMSLNRFKHIIDQAAHHTNQVALGGRGDPNHHPEFEQIVDYCRRNNISPNYTTSGIGLTNKQVEISKQCGAVAVSDYGNRFTYEAIRKFQDAKIKTNIHYLFSRKSAFNAFAFLNGHNPWGDKVDLSRLNAVVFLLFKPEGQGFKLASSHIPSPDQLKMFSDLVTKNKAQTKVGMDSCTVNHIKVPRKMEMFMSTCEAGRYSAYITPKGTLLPCSFLNSFYRQLPTTADLMESWKTSEIFSMFRDTLKEKSTCPCGFNYKTIQE